MTTFAHRTAAPTPCPPRSFQWREQCHKCGIPKESAGITLDPSAATAAGGYSGYSADPYATGSYDASYGTGAAAAGGGGGGMQAGQNMRPGDWRCLGCGNVK